MIALVSSSAEGGVRKHILDLLHNSSVLKKKCSLVMYSRNQQDEIFQNRARENYNWRGLYITKSVGLIDVYNVFLVVWHLYKNKIMVAHAHGAKAGLYVRIAKLFKWNLLVIYSPHGGAFHKENQIKSTALIIKLETFLDKLTSELIFESWYALSLYGESIKSSIVKKTVIYNSVEPQFVVSRQKIISQSIEKNRQNGFLIITLVGRIRHIKGHDLLISALRKLERPVFVYFVGTYEPDYKTKLDGLLHGISHCYWGDEIDVSGFYIHTDILAVPSRAESFGYVPIEASLHNCVIVASKIPPFLETLASYDRVYFFEPNNSAALAESLQQAVQSAHLRVEIKRETPFALSSFIDNFDRIYLGLLEEGGFPDSSSYKSY